MNISHIPAGSLSAQDVDSFIAEVVEFDRILNVASGLGPDFDPLPTEVRQSFLEAGEFTTREHWIARNDDRIVAKGIAYLSLTDNLELAEVWVGVHPDFRRQGIGTSLFDSMTASLRDGGRTKLVSFNELAAQEYDTWHRQAHVAAETGTGSLPHSVAEVAFLERQGFNLKQLERCSVADVRVASEIAIDPLDEGYRIVQWTGAAPQEHLDGLAFLYQKMSTDTPGAEELMEEEDWNPARVREHEAEREKAGQTVFTALALGVLPDGTEEAAGFTEVSIFADRPTVGWQGATLVAKTHRGHRLGAHLKIANHVAIGNGSDVERVYTWNATENSHMLSINNQAGFETHAWTGVWKKNNLPLA